jgi:hypothetical protein
MRAGGGEERLRKHANGRVTQVAGYGREERSAYKESNAEDDGT